MDESNGNNNNRLGSLDIKFLLVQLNELYNKEQKLLLAYKQLQEDKELLQTLIMHQSNKIARVRQWV